MIKGEWLLIILLLIPVFAVFAQIGPPSLQDGKNLVENVSSSTKSFISRVGEGIKGFFNSIAPFFQGSDKKITSWWNDSAKPWFVNIFADLSTYFDKEIIIR